MVDFKRILLPAALCVSLAACAGVRDSSGYIAMPELVDAVEVGIDNKASVERTLGRPTFTGQFDDKNWYYVTRQTSQFAFRKPKLTDASIIHVQFDDAGNVAVVDRGGPELAVNIDPAGGKTPTLGREKSFFEELFGNIGSVGQAGMLAPEQTQ
ncbi:outer membrane protein assembly factor BamE [Sphingomicrobium nitratireducens]|uniref:outer membrane protein assembly factor BamE n=1 Tax=Sphingomicrobium nitratireducens TaxID=2964666 RepID=UPI002240367B|nr:outer membrane protein assembly factor BamE [Sphingomicrobium nitratireducens]